MSTQEEKPIYGIGDLLWAKIGHHPFWPCMVSYDPYEASYFKTSITGKIRSIIYHVQYFGKEALRGWTSPKSIFPFEGEREYFRYKRKLLNETIQPSLKKLLNKKYHVRAAVHENWILACREAESAALTEDPLLRYESFVFNYDLNLKRSSKEKGAVRKKKSKLELDNEKKIREPYDADHSLCSICEKKDVDLYCRGSCLRNFHKDCLGLLQAPEPFYCVDCARNVNICYVCKKGDTPVFKCKKCPFHFHKECLMKFICADITKELCSLHACMSCYNENPSNIYSKGPVVACIRCPTVFHASKNCVPAGSVQVSPSAIICPDHFRGKAKVSPLPTCNVSYCCECAEGGELICCESCPYAYHADCLGKAVPEGDFFCEDCTKRKYLHVGNIVWAKTGQYRWWPAQIVHLDDLPPKINARDCYMGEFAVLYFGTEEYYFAHRGRVMPYGEHHKDSCCGPKPGPKQCLEEASKAYDEYVSQQKKEIQKKDKPESYKYIHINRPIHPAQTYTIDKHSYPACNCKTNRPFPCTSDCINKSTLVECHPDVCKAGTYCGNMKFHNREYAQVKVIKTEDRGWGLQAQQLIHKGAFVIEYVGEIITHEEYRRRTVVMREKKIQNYYFLYLDSRRMIDAGPRGNFSRFINHSCDPNCEMSKWYVKGDSRIGIFAITTIHPGEELTFNYHSDNIQFQQQCFCGSENCVGVIGKEKHASKKSKMK